MKRTFPPDQHIPFRGTIRHYHRGGVRPQRSWDDWVDGVSGNTPGAKNWPKILLILIGILALGGIITGLGIELS